MKDTIISFIVMAFFVFLIAALVYVENSTEKGEYFEIQLRRNLLYPKDIIKTDTALVLFVEEDIVYYRLNNFDDTTSTLTCTLEIFEMYSKEIELNISLK